MKHSDGERLSEWEPPLLTRLSAAAGSLGGGIALTWKEDTMGEPGLVHQVICDPTHPTSCFWNCDVAFAAAPSP